MSDSILHDLDDKVVASYSEDVETVLKMNHEQRESQGRFDKKGEWHQTFRVPMTVIVEIMTKYGLDFYDSDDWKKIVKILKSEYPACRTYNGNI